MSARICSCKSHLPACNPVVFHGKKGSQLCTCPPIAGLGLCACIIVVSSCPIGFPVPFLLNWKQPQSEFIHANELLKL